MLANNIEAPVEAQPLTETKVCEWTADGYSYVIGFTATGEYSAAFVLKVDGQPWYMYQTSPGNRTAYIADRGIKLEAGKKVALYVKHDDTSVQSFVGTILGGK